MKHKSEAQSVDLQAKLFPGFSDPSCLAILEALRDGPLPAGEIVAHILSPADERPAEVAKGVYECPRHTAKEARRARN